MEHAEITVSSDNCMYAIFGYASEEDVYKYMASTIKDVEATICARCESYVPDCKYIINIPRRTEESRTYAYIWVTSKPVLWMLTGKNHDGATLDTVPRKLTPLISDVSVSKQLFAADWSETLPVIFEEYVIPVMLENTIKPFFLRAIATYPSEEYDVGTLYCKTILPQGYNESFLVNLFAPFNHSRHPVQVTKTYKGNAYIKFPNEADACFALMLTKKHYDVERQILLSFDYALVRSQPKEQSKARYNKPKSYREQYKSTKQSRRY